MHRDRLYRDASIQGRPFVFNQAVVEVFPDMIRRSVPGYARTLDVIGRLAQAHLRPGTRGYDLGCSLGAALLAMRQAAPAGIECLIGVDSSPAMIERCQAIVAAEPSPTPVELVTSDLREVPIEHASMVTLNYTLQFVPPDDRNRVLAAIAAGLVDGGLLVVSEKIRFDDDPVSRAIVGLHEDFKRDQGYDEMEIAGKRAALEDVLVPDTVGDLTRRLEEAGFAAAGVWLQHYNFVSLLAFK